ncbi:hypothetical protein [Nocardia iowensis]|uniref:Uncharacterized protein n=1 Tax=Nocardia iowensis TaxID=204891 RepID=A0ABX8RMW0_NOCIO|nr:hypothetical protein [Nocardia iowensis]QXN89760.1 hypothetical protein KV110_30465 [Nocardia iowensis]
MNLTDRLIAPHATRGEVTASFATAFVGAALAFGLALDAEWSWLCVAVVTFVAFDLFGGAVVNATTAAKRWFHRPGRTARHHLGFVAIHVQPFLLALVTPGFGWFTAAVIYALALSGAVLITVAPRDLRRPIAFGTTAVALTVATSILTTPNALTWFAPVLLIKLLLAHLLPEDTDH